jgi:hypothetical protein
MPLLWHMFLRKRRKVFSGGGRRGKNPDDGRCMYDGSPKGFGHHHSPKMFVPLSLIMLSLPVSAIVLFTAP